MQTLDPALAVVDRPSQHLDGLVDGLSLKQSLRVRLHGGVIVRIDLQRPSQRRFGGPGVVAGFQRVSDRDVHPALVAGQVLGLAEEVESAVEVPE